MQKRDIPAFQDENVSGLAFEVKFGKIAFAFQSETVLVHEAVSGELILKILHVE